MVGAVYPGTNAPRTYLEFGSSGQAYGYGPVNLKAVWGGAVGVAGEFAGSYGTLATPVTLANKQ